MPSDILEILIDAAAAGAAEVLAVRGSGAIGAGYKDAKELVTEADRRSDAAMLRVFRSRAPGISLRLEESGDTGSLDERWIGADPLDGTSHFACGGVSYSIQAHYVEAGVPLAGVVFQPEVYLPLSETPNCMGRIACATRGGGALWRRSEFDGTGFRFGEPRRFTPRHADGLKSYVSCVPLSTKMTAEEAARARRVLESGLIAVTTGAGGAGGNVMLCLFGGQHVYANFGAGEDLDLIPPQVIAEEAGLTVWGVDRRPPVWRTRKQPMVVAPTAEIADRFLSAAGFPAPAGLPA